jgi:hypothetical protein
MMALETDDKPKRRGTTMLSPFPGMDPYLENTARWRGFHNAFVIGLTYALNEGLPAGFIAEAEERCYTLPSRDVIYPDALVLRAYVAEPGEASRTSGGGAGGTALREPPTVTVSSPLVFRRVREEQREMYVRIVAAGSDGRVLTVIELFSPANKGRGEGRREYLEKQSAVLESDSNLLEIDLLRAGQYTAAFEREPIAAQKTFDYLVCLARAESDGERTFMCWPFTTRERLPVIRVPLTPELPDMTLDLGPILADVYVGGRYGNRIDYTAEPEPPLAAADAEWADDLLREKGLRKKLG